jgi:hypothetical protein
MDLTTKLNIALTEQRIALLRNLIATLASKGKDVSEHRRMLAAEERYVASGCAPPETPELSASTTGTTAGYIMPPGAK